MPLREVWKHEALDFTQWLAIPENIQLLSEVIGVEIVETQSEVGVGQFFVDILATDENDRRIVIENQLAPTDHDHLGKIITYAAGLHADVVVWIVERAREEHEQAVNWLNENTTDQANFFLLQIEAWKIGDSLPAPRFNIVAKPNDWAKAVKQTAASGTVSELKLKQQDFFERVREYGEAHAKYIKSWAKPAPQHWYDVAIGTSQAYIDLTVNSLQKHVGVGLYIINNKELYAKLNDAREEIESQLGLVLDWQELPQKKASRITITRNGDFADPGQLDEIISWMATTADAFAKVFPKYL
ncbi:DUF4268 domain-containing protein [Mycolicibacterium duvalii]|uniref:DUF4268 domain-containing protein n=1 Tax=Mycolicibacterium duvalii TaxID=39688 RepID=UPI0013D8B319|nr:DUF4268 domain-containing protein [Mycolicibacterium duvalii]MCV7367727.1 DUF4268 domain-containing protein [Mycolicibacterium duvalii]